MLNVDEGIVSPALKGAGPIDQQTEILLGYHRQNMQSVFTPGTRQSNLRPAIISMRDKTKFDGPRRFFLVPLVEFHKGTAKKCQEPPRIQTTN